MSPALLGICLGIVNVLVNGALFALMSDEPRGAHAVVTYGMLPGITAGSLIGAMAGATAKATRVSRLMVIGIPAIVVVLILGAAFELTEFVPFALAPTLLCCVVLEWRTRKASFALDDTPRPRSALKLSMFLGAVVMFVVLLGLFAKEDDLRVLPAVYLPWGLGCGLALAAPFGAIADQTRAWSVWPRRIVLLVAGLALTVALATFVGMESMIVVAWHPR